MHTTHLRPGGLRARIRLFALPGVLALCVLFAVAVAGAGCTRSSADAGSSPIDRETALRQIASDYARSGDLSQMQAALDKLGMANPGQLVLALAEADINAGRGQAEIEPVARLADALGVRSPKLIAYLAPTSVPMPTSTSIPPTATAAPPTATLAPTVTLQPPTPPPPTAMPTPRPQQARVVADSAINLRSGPGRAYPVVGQIRAGQELTIVARNASGDWWQLAWDGQGQAWVAGTVVRVLGPIDTVAIAENIPAPPPQPTAAPRPTAAPTSPPVAAGPNFRVERIRLWGVQENGGYFDGPSVHCGEKRQLRVMVFDAAGNPLNGVTIKSAFGDGEEQVTGSKGPGIAEYVLGTGQDVYVVRDADGRDVTSDYARGMSTQPEGISQDQLIAAGYCSDAASCAYHVTQSCRGHYSWDVTFRRAY